MKYSSYSHSGYGFLPLSMGELPNAISAKVKGWLVKE